METKELQQELIDILNTEISLQEAEIIEDIMYRKDEGIIELENGRKYRIINDDVIWDIYKEEQEQSLEECYPELFKNIPWWVEIDMEATITNIYDTDGYGSLFATYDGAEHFIKTNLGNFYIFRTN